MPDAAIFMQWDNYAEPDGRPRFFAADPLTFNSRQERLHSLAPGDRLWLVSRSPDDQQYYFIAVLTVKSLIRNPAASRENAQFGEYAILSDRSTSHDLGTSFPAEGLLRALQFETNKPIRHGASIGQSLQALRLLSDLDARILNAALQRILQDENQFLDAPCGLWTKCDRVFADYFVNNWNERRQPLAFLLYDSPPALQPGAPVFIHSEKHLRIIARFRQSQFVAGQKFTVEEPERLAERERIWTTWRADTLDPPERSDFDAFWSKQHGVRSLFVMDEVYAVSSPPQFKTYGRALEWGYPTGVGFRYLNLSQSYLLMRTSQLSNEECWSYLSSVLVD